MKHNIRFKKLSRDTKHRISLSKNISMCLLFHKEIVTTKAKADAVISIVNKIIHKIKHQNDIRSKIRIIKMYLISHNLFYIKNNK